MISETDILKILKKILKTSDNIKEDFEIFENLDSLFFAELCMELEDKANELDFNFDWNSKNSIKNIDKIFKNAKTLSIEFNRQLNN